MKLRFLMPSDVPLANTDVALIEALREELLQRPGMAEARHADDADAMVIHEPWAFREWRYIARLMNDPVIGRAPQKVFTINSDDAATGLLRGVYTCLAKKRFDPALHAAVPFFAQPNEQVLPNAGLRVGNAPLVPTWRGNPKSQRRLRGRLLDLYGGSSIFRVESTDSWWNHEAEEKLRYIRLLRLGKFALCPAGWGAASMRIFESMALGVAPVIIADEFVEPAGPDWSTFAIRVPESEVARLEPILEAYIERYEEMGALAHQAWLDHYQPSRLMACYSDNLMRCMRGNLESSPPAEFRRWRSRRMYSTNGWTLPQRISNRVKRALHV